MPLPQAGKRERAFIEEHKVARLATIDESGRPHVVPICYAYDGRHIYSAVDKKPKRVAPERLRRIRNIERDPRVALVIDEYHDDWSRLGYVLIQGMAEVLKAGPERKAALMLLREKYPQYLEMLKEGEEGPVIRIRPAKISGWGAV